MEDRDHNPGLGIFTKFDILNSGVVWEDTTTSNGTIFVDLLVRKDTLRVYNVHIGSMGLKMAQYKNPEYYGHKLKTLITKLRNGATNRSTQIDRLIEHTKTSPYPYLICGDFNEIPYSYNYLRLRKHFSNAFEKAGHGFGFSVNGSLFFLRIDHQFYGPRLKALNYEVDRTMRISDHFATRGYYELESE
jgi:endonuclease/exonuclease/phosphatase (EEP) superfamily protein YafD